MRVPTIKIAADDGYCVINESDFDPDKHTRYGEAKITPTPNPSPALTDEDVARRAAVEIPDDWSGAHWKTSVALAQDIMGDDSVTTKDEAIAVIGGELARRAMGEGPLTVAS